MEPGARAGCPSLLCSSPTRAACLPFLPCRPPLLRIEQFLHCAPKLAEFIPDLKVSSRTIETWLGLAIGVVRDSTGVCTYTRYDSGS